ncbi:hypothetical protein [Arthrobacter sp. AQ5-05]|uniref:hypothetical protein n=1 Tax=Arthrobacter sp. AQ5-05 TaxID=2184581 RepID=UPI001E320E44|nr:hypothetical protein [Arthrobacter sp. AQ5-05]
MAACATAGSCGTIVGFCDVVGSVGVDVVDGCVLVGVGGGVDAGQHGFVLQDGEMAVEADQSAAGAAEEDALLG